MTLMRQIPAFFVALALALPAAGAPRRPVPKVEAPEEEEDPDFRGLPAGQDLQSLVAHLGACISELAASQSAVPSVDLFIANLERQLRRGNDVPRDKILRNADAAREELRLAYNALAEVASPLLPSVRDVFADVNERLGPIHQRARENILRLRDVAEAARELVAAMVLERPASPGRPISIAALNAIASQETEIRALRIRLKQAERDLARAKSLIQQAKSLAASVQGFSQKAADLDQDALTRVSQRRTRGTPTQAVTAMNSREVLANANQWLQAAVARAESIVRLLEHEGTLAAIDRTGEADVSIQNGKDVEIRSAERINFNHEIRMNDLIPYGWDVASDERKGWWANRARMAKGSSAEDSAKMSTAHREGEENQGKAEKAREISARTIARVSDYLGRAARKPEALVKRLTDVPMIKEGGGKIASPRGGGQEVRSKPLKVPKTFDVSDQEIIESMDGLSGGR